MWTISISDFFPTLPSSGLFWFSNHTLQQLIDVVSVHLLDGSEPVDQHDELVLGALRGAIKMIFHPWSMVKNAPCVEH